MSPPAALSSSSTVLIADEMRVKTAVASLQACSVLAQRVIVHAHVSNVCIAWGRLNRQNLGVWLLRGARLAEAPERTFPRLICYRALLLERQQSCSRTLHDLPQLCFGFCAQQVEVEPFRFCRFSLVSRVLGCFVASLSWCCRSALLACSCRLLVLVLPCVFVLLVSFCNTCFFKVAFYP